MRKALLVSFVILVCAVIVSHPWFESRAQVKTDAQPAGRPLREETFARLIDSAKASGTVRVIVGLNTSFQPEGNLSNPDMARQRQDIKSAQQDFLADYQTLRGASVKQFEYIPFLAFETDAATLERMQNDPRISSLEEDVVDSPHLTESTGIVGATTAWTSGFTGAGQNVAVLDTGVAKGHSFLTGKVASEACYSTTNASGLSVCPGGVSESTATDSGVNCDLAVNGCNHGSHVAGITAGTSVSFSGVARGANIIAIQVFSRFNAAADCGTTPTPCALSFVSDQIKGLERVRTLRDTMPIAAVNMSLGGGSFTSNCDAAQASRKAAIDNLRSVGTATVISSGNSGFTNAIGAPACISTAVSVGSTDDGSLGVPLDAVSGFSNSASFLTMLAPGRWISSSVPPGNGFSNFSGTSMAAPHVAGAWALLKQNVPTASVTAVQTALVSTGLLITDSRNGIVKPRIRLAQALQVVARTPFDYDGDRKADISVFRPSSGLWFIQNSNNGSVLINQFGIATDLTVPADYDADGKTDIAVWRPSTGVWFWLNSSNGTLGGNQFGLAGDRPAPADYDRDGKADIMIYRPAGGLWWLLRSSDGAVTVSQFGIAEDRPTMGDFDGDGKADLAVFRPSTATWFRLNSGDGAFVANSFGLVGDKPISADYDGDGRTDIAIFRPSAGAWYWQNSSNGTISAVSWGLSTDVATPGDYDGDGRSDPAVFRPSENNWYSLRSTSGFTVVTFGSAGDRPTPNSFVP